MHSTLFESLDARQYFSGGFDDDWAKAQAILNGSYFVQFGDVNKDKRLTYDEQFNNLKKTVKDANGDGKIDVHDLQVAGRVETSGMVEAIKYMDHVDWYETGRTSGAHAWVNADGVLAIDGGGKMSIEVSGKYIKYVENGTQLGRFTAKSVKRIDVFGGSKADTIKLGDTGKPMTVYGRGGDDTITGSGAADSIYGGAGNDQIHGNGGDDYLCGVDGDDRLWGDGGNDKLEGNGGKDHLDGGSGKNSLNGGASIDYLTVRSKDKTDKDKLDKLSIIK